MEFLISHSLTVELSDKTQGALLFCWSLRDLYYELFSSEINFVGLEKCFNMISSKDVQPDS